MLNRMNGWQRLWFVLSILGFIGFGFLGAVIHAAKSGENSEYISGLMKDFENSKCNKYAEEPFDNLEEPEYVRYGGNCWHIFTSRLYGSRETPFTWEVYNADTREQKVENFFDWLIVFGGLSLIVSGLVYAAGSLVNWVRKGFIKTKEID